MARENWVVLSGRRDQVRTISKLNITLKTNDLYKPNTEASKYLNTNWIECIYEFF